MPIKNGVTCGKSQCTKLPAHVDFALQNHVLLCFSQNRRSDCDTSGGISGEGLLRHATRINIPHPCLLVHVYQIACELGGI